MPHRAPTRACTLEPFNTRPLDAGAVGQAHRSTRATALECGQRARFVLRHRVMCPTPHRCWRKRMHTVKRAGSNGLHVGACIDANPPALCALNMHTDHARAGVVLDVQVRAGDTTSLVIELLERRMRALIRLGCAVVALAPTIVGARGPVAGSSDLAIRSALRRPW